MIPMDFDSELNRLHNDIFKNMDYLLKVAQGNPHIDFIKFQIAISELILSSIAHGKLQERINNQ